jgi:hypothetical protein
MKIEKKLVALSIFALIIGISIVVPVTFFMNEKTQKYDDPWFNIEIPYAYFEVNMLNDSYAYHYLLDVLAIQPSINYNALNQQLDGRIEYLEYTVYTDNMQLSSNTYHLSINNTDNENMFDPFSFYNGHYFNSSYADTFPSYKNYNYYHIKDPAQLPPMLRTGSISSINEAEYNSILVELENTQTIYIDIKRVGYITFEGDTPIVTLAGNKIIQHIELTKNGNAFTFGDKDITGINWNLTRLFAYGVMVTFNVDDLTSHYTSTDQFPIGVEIIWEDDFE